ncbi:MAG: hypothetical protein HOP07_01320 [Bacteriovoracaceae bacterium]|nr:hypothetical protein [Bacteriovoracaceae bacterium]
MGISIFQIALSITFFSVGYYFKARFEINQENEITKLKNIIQHIVVEDHKEELRLQKYKHNQLEQSKYFLERDFLEFKEKVKLNRFDKIESIKNEKDSVSKALKQFL